jgi:primosomal protein N' (replication factor Y)
MPSPLVKAHGQFRFQITLRAPKPRALSRHVQQVLENTPSPDDVTVVFDMDAWSFV